MPQHKEAARAARERQWMAANDKRCDACWRMAPCSCQDPNRCESTLDRFPLKRCSLRKRDASFCEFHQPYPNMGKMAADYARRCDSVGLPYLIQQFTAWAYPGREAPDIHNFTLYCSSMKCSTE